MSSSYGFLEAPSRADCRMRICNNPAGLCPPDKCFHAEFEHHRPKTPIHWDQVVAAAAKVARWAAPKRIKRIIAITRGGLTPAHLVANYIDCKVIDTIGLASYSDQERFDPIVTKYPGGSSYHVDGPVLLIDDIYDTGETLRKARKIFPYELHTAALFGKSRGEAKDIDCIGAPFVAGEWLVMPWELEACPVL